MTNPPTPTGRRGGRPRKQRRPRTLDDVAAARQPRAVIYARVSSRQQAESGLSREDQERRCRAYADALGYDVVATFADNGQSGSIEPDRRPAASEALAMLDDGDADVLLALKQDRLTRQPGDLYRLIDRAEAGGWFLACVLDGIDARTPYGAALCGMRAVFGRLEVDLGSERSTAAAAQRRERGDRLGKAPSPETRAAGGDVLDLRASGLSWQQVADELAARGHRRPNGGAWTPTAARRCAISRLIDDNPRLTPDDAADRLAAL